MWIRDYENLVGQICSFTEKMHMEMVPPRKDVKCIHQGGLVSIPNCDQKCMQVMPNIHIQIDSYIYYIRPASYVKLHSKGDSSIIVEEDEESTNGGDKTFFATLKIFPTAQKTWILGLPFLADFY